MSTLGSLPLVWGPIRLTISGNNAAAHASTASSTHNLSAGTPGRAAIRQNTPAPAMPTPTPANTVPAKLARPSLANHARVHAVVATSDHALSTPARNRSSDQAKTEDVQPTAAVTSTIPMRPSLNSDVAPIRRRAATVAPTRYPR